MKKNSIISILIAVAVVAANSALVAFAFSDNTTNITAQVHQEQEANVSQEQRDLLADIQEDVGGDIMQATMIVEGSVMEDEAIAIAKNAVKEKFDVSLDKYNVMQILAGSLKSEEEPNWFISFSPKDLTINNASVYIVCVDSKTGNVISAERN